MPLLELLSEEGIETPLKRLYTKAILMERIQLFLKKLTGSDGSKENAVNAFMKEEKKSL